MSESPFRGPTPTPAVLPNAALRQNYALDEDSFIKSTEARLDEFIAQGQEVLNNLVDQRNILKGTQRRLLSAANTLGLSREVIGWIERRRYARTIKLHIFKVLTREGKKVRKICISLSQAPYSHFSVFIGFGDGLVKAIMMSSCNIYHPINLYARI